MNFHIFTFISRVKARSLLQSQLFTGLARKRGEWHSTHHLAQQIVVARFSRSRWTTWKSLIESLSYVRDDRLDYIVTLKEYLDPLVEY